VKKKDLNAVNPDNAARMIAGTAPFDGRRSRRLISPQP
jgi:ribosomal protein L11